MTKNEIMKIVQTAIMNNDFDWTSLNTFRIWYKEPFTDSEGVMGTELGAREFEIKQVSGKDV